MTGGITLGPLPQNFGSYELIDGVLSVSGGVDVGGGGQDSSGHVVIGGGVATVTHNIHVAEGSDLALSGGTLNVDTLTNDGNFYYSGGSFFGNLTNNKMVTFTGGHRVITGNFVNNANATWKTTNTVLVVTGTMTDNGTHVSDPSDEHYNNLVVNETGTITGWGRNRYFIEGDFINKSARAGEWDTRENELHFEGARQHTLGITGSDLGADPRGYSDNFAWSELALGTV